MKKNRSLIAVFRSNKMAMASLYFLVTFFILAACASLIANEKPLFVRYNGENLYPAFSQNNLEEKDWGRLKTEWIIWAPIRFSPGKSDHLRMDYSEPTSTHLLGTSKNGADVFAGIIHGARFSLSIGILSMLIASLIGITLGSLAGYFGDYRLQITRGCTWMLVAGIIPAWFYGFYIRSNVLSGLFNDPGLATFFSIVFSILIFLVVLVLFYRAGKLLSMIGYFSAKKPVAIDSFVSKATEVFVSIPRLVLILTIAAISRPSFINLVLIIGFTSWTEIARFTRAELLRASGHEYLQSAKSLGLSDLRIILRHALPNALAPATVAIVFGIASAILIESGLSFLGIGVPQDTVTWGSLLFAGKENFDAWWLVLFPGLAIFLTVTAFNLAGDGIRDALDVRSGSR